MEIRALNIESAKDLALEYLKSLNSEEELVILDEETRVESFGWIFFYNTKQYKETGDFMFMLGGNAPLIVDKNKGTLSVTGTTFDIEHYIKEYKSSL